MEIIFSPDHLIRILKENFRPESRIAVLGTVQFLRAVQEVKASCQDYFAKIEIPQVKPLSQGIGYSPHMSNTISFR